MRRARAGLGHHVHGRADAPRFRRAQQPRQLRAVLFIRRVERVQQQDVADVQQVHVEAVPVDVRLAEVGAGALAVVERALLADLVGHHERERRGARAHDAAEVDVRIRAQAREHVVPRLVLAHAPQRRQRQVRVKRGQVHDVVAHAAARRAAHLAHDVRQLARLREALDRIEDVQHRGARHGNALLHAPRLAFCIHYTAFRRETPDEKA